jgi:sarcosine oxidase
VTDTYDVIVLGLGGMGSAAAAHLAARGTTVLGLEQFTPGHALGSSHGDSRVIRQAYFEDPAYVPLLLRSYELFEDLNHDDPGLFTETGGLMMGAPDSLTVAGSLLSAQQWDLPHEVLDHEQITRRFPEFQPQPDTIALYERRAGFIRPERTVLAHLARAGKAGADLRFQHPVLSWTATGDGVSVTTATEKFHARHLIVTPGAWAPSMLAELKLPLVVERQLLFWFQPRAGVEAFEVGRQPVFIWQPPSPLQMYGFPAIDGPSGGVKVAFFRNGVESDPDALDREVHPDEVELMRGYLAETLPALAAGEYLRGVACMYTTTPDEHFVIAPHPEHSNVTVAAGFSGHGFKFVPVIGEILADLALDGVTRHPIDLFDPARFS